MTIAMHTTRTFIMEGAALAVHRGYQGALYALAAKGAPALMSCVDVVAPGTDIFGRIAPTGESTDIVFGEPVVWKSYFGDVLVPSSVEQVRLGTTIAFDFDPARRNALIYVPRSTCSIAIRQSSNSDGTMCFGWLQKLGRLDPGLYNGCTMREMVGLHDDVISHIEALNGIQPLGLSSVETACPASFQSDGVTLVRQARNLSRSRGGVAYATDDGAWRMCIGYGATALQPLRVIRGDGAGMSFAEMLAIPAPALDAFAALLIHLRSLSLPGTRGLSFAPPFAKAA